MKRESLCFLLGGFAFGILCGFALFHALDNPPVLASGSASMAAMGSSDSPSGAGLGGVAGAPKAKRINQLRRDLDQDPRNIAASVELADIYQRDSMWAEAASFYERALEIEPAHSQLLVNLGLCYRGLERYDEALATLAAAYEADPTNRAALFNVVIVAALDLGRFDVAIEAMDTLEAIPAASGGPDDGQLRELREWLMEAQAAAVAEG